MSNATDSDPDLDRSIRSLLATVTAATPRPPTIEHLDDLSVRRLDRVNRAQRRPMFAVASGPVAAAALVVGVITFTGDRDAEPQDRSAASAQVAPSAVPRLPAHVVPTYLPEGWVLADVSEQAYHDPSGSPYTPSQLFRRTSDGAAVRLELSVVDVDGADSEDAIADYEELTEQIDIQRSLVDITDGYGQFDLMGSTVSVQTVGLSDADAETFVRSVVPDESSPNLRFTAPEASGFVLEAEAAPPTSSRSVAGSLTYVVDGERGWSLLVQPEDSNTLARFGVPTVVDGVTLYVGRRWTSRESIGGVVVSAAHFGEDVDTVDRVLASLELTDASTWSQMADDLAERYMRLPALASLILPNSGVEVSQRDAGLFKPVCVNDESTARCHAFVGADVGPNWIVREVFWASFDVGSGWVFAGVFQIVRPPANEVTVELDAGVLVDSSTAEVDARTFVAIGLSNETTNGSYEIRSGTESGSALTSGELTYPII